ncbi:MAG: V-type ATPase subunit [Spirochaetaceae bacterium]|nr:V-type ATPase subunit [Spirochaetaceae bacterium]
MSAERAFVYAKACGIIAKSFLESRLERLAEISTLSDFEYCMEGRKDAPDSIISVMKAFPKPPEVLVRLVKSYEYADVKNILSALKNGLECPVFTKLGRFAGAKLSAFPNARLMFHGTEYEFLLRHDLQSPDDDCGELAALLDKHYYETLLDVLRRLPKNEAPAFRYIITEEISLMNCAWALRLRAYYGMPAEAVRERLIDQKLENGGESLAKDAIKSLNLALDHRPEWEDWRRVRFLNIESAGHFWKCDPRAFQNAASVYLYELARKNLRRRAFTLDTAACFIRLKQFEEQVLNGVAEGLKLGTSAEEVLALMRGAA